MTFLIQCNNQGCFQLQSSQLDVSTNQVICMNCGNEIKNITDFAKQQLKRSGQITGKNKSQKSHAIKCTHCQLIDLPKIENDSFLCVGCNKELDISIPFKKLLKEYFKNEKKSL